MLVRPILVDPGLTRKGSKRRSTCLPLTFLGRAVSSMTRMASDAPTCAPSFVFVSQMIKHSGSGRGKQAAMLAHGDQVSRSKEHLMSKTIVAGLSALFITASSLAYAQVSTGPAQSSGPTQAGPTQERLSDAEFKTEFKTLTDRRIELIK